MSIDIDEKTLSIKEAYLAMYEYLKREIELSGGRNVDVRGMLVELELTDDWESMAEGCTEIFEECVETVLEGRSVLNAQDIAL